MKIDIFARLQKEDGDIFQKEAYNPVAIEFIRDTVGGKPYNSRGEPRPGFFDTNYQFL